MLCVMNRERNHSPSLSDYGTHSHKKTCRARNAPHPLLQKKKQNTRTLQDTQVFSCQNCSAYIYKHSVIRRCHVAIANNLHIIWKADSSNNILLKWLLLRHFQGFCNISSWESLFPTLRVAKPFSECQKAHSHHLNEETHLSVSTPISNWDLDPKPRGVLYESHQSSMYNSEAC